MTDLINLIAKYGWLPVVLAVVLYILLKGEIIFRYPAGGEGSRKQGKRDPFEPPGG
jgi:hypothetical protein